MTFAVLLTGNPVNAMGKGIQGGNGVSIVIHNRPEALPAPMLAFPA